MTQKYFFKLYTNTYAYRIEFYFSLQYGGNKIAATNVWNVTNKRKNNVRSSLEAWLKMSKASWKSLFKVINP